MVFAAQRHIWLCSVCLANTTLVDDTHSIMTAWQPAWMCVQLISRCVSEVTVLITKIRYRFHNLGKVAHCYVILKQCVWRINAESLPFISTCGVCSPAIIFPLWLLLAFSLMPVLLPFKTNQRLNKISCLYFLYASCDMMSLCRKSSQLWIKKWSKQ